MESDNEAQIGIKCSHRLHKAVRRAAAEEDRTMSSYIRVMLEEKLFPGKFSDGKKRNAA